MPKKEKVIECSCSGKLIKMKEKKIFDNKYGIFCEFYRCNKCKTETFSGKQLEKLADNFDNLFNQSNPIKLETPIKKNFFLI